MLRKSIITMFYLHDVAEGLNSGSANAGNSPSDDEGILDEECDDFYLLPEANLKMRSIRSPQALDRMMFSHWISSLHPLLLAFRRL